MVRWYVLGTSNTFCNPNNTTCKVKVGSSSLQLCCCLYSAGTVALVRIEKMGAARYQLFLDGTLMTAGILCRVCPIHLCFLYRGLKKDWWTSYVCIISGHWNWHSMKSGLQREFSMYNHKHPVKISVKVSLLVAMVGLGEFKLVQVQVRNSLQFNITGCGKVLINGQDWRDWMNFMPTFISRIRNDFEVPVWNVALIRVSFLKVF